MSFEKLFKILSYLPIAKIADDVIESVISDTVTILSSATGSGKTLFVTSLLAEMESSERVVVLVPRRFLAVHAAEIIAELTETKIGTLVGYAVGSQSGDKSCFDREQTRLLFATYGYALASGLVKTAKVVVLDEVHETTLELSIVRALIYRRLADGEKIKLLEMSATMDAVQQSAYWDAISTTHIFRIDGSTHPCERRHRPAGNPAHEVMTLIEEGRRGILVFRPGVGEVQETAEEITKLAEAAKIQVEVRQIYGEMDHTERHEATQTPAPGTVKVLVGTNVVESGVNITWLDAGVSCGTGKENSVRPATGATYLALINLPQWRLDQQEGRVKRFGPGVFVLCSHLSYGEREVMTVPEIRRLSLTTLVLHCASFGLRTHDLKFDYAPDADKVREAEIHLQRLGLIDVDCKLTEAGENTIDLPIGPETSAMLWHAWKRECLDRAIVLAAVIEVGGLRKDFCFGHYLNHTSDHLDGLMAFIQASILHGVERRTFMEERNISYKKFSAAQDLLRDLERRLTETASFDLDGVIPQLRQSIIAGSLNRIFLGNEYGGMVRPIQSPFTLYSIGQGSALSNSLRQSIVTGELRVITPRNKFKSPFTVLEKVTAATLDDIRAVAQIRPEILNKEEGVYKLFGEYELPMYDSVQTGDENDWPEDGLGFKSRVYRW